MILIMSAIVEYTIIVNSGKEFLMFKKERNWMVEWTIEKYLILFIARIRCNAR